MTNVPLSQINIDSDLPLGGTKKITDARQIGLKENDTVGAKTAVIEINSAGQVVIGDGTNPAVPFFSVVAGKVVGGALPVGNEVLSTVVAPTVTNTFLKAVVAGSNISFVWEAVSGGSFALSGDPTPTLAGDMVTGANKIKKGTAGTDAYVKMGTSLIEVGTGAGVSYTVPTGGVAHKPAKMNSAGNAIEFANIRAVDVGLAATYTGNLAGPAPTTVEALGTAVDGLNTGLRPVHRYYKLRDDFDNIETSVFTTGSEVSGSNWVLAGKDSQIECVAPTLAGEGGILRLHTLSYSASTAVIAKKSGYFYTGEDFTLRAKVRNGTLTGGGGWHFIIGLVKPSTNLYSMLALSSPLHGITEGIFAKGSVSDTSVTFQGNTRNLSSTSTTATSQQYLNLNTEIRIRRVGSNVQFSFGGEAYTTLTTNIPNNVELIPLIGLLTANSVSGDMRIDYLDVEIGLTGRGDE